MFVLGDLLERRVPLMTLRCRNTGHVEKSEESRRAHEGPRLLARVAAEQLENEPLLRSNPQQFLVEGIEARGQRLGPDALFGPQQVTDGRKGQAYPAIPADPGKPHGVGGAIAAVPRPRSSGGLEQADAVVVEERAAGQAAARGELSDAQPGCACSSRRSIAPVVR
jgi:hypothetical protein